MMQQIVGHLADWSLSDKIAAIASAAGVLQVIALIATIAVTRRHGRQQLRAYVGISHFEQQQNLSATIRVQGKAFALVAIRNFGQTPAYRIRTRASVKVREHPLQYGLLTSDAKKGNSETTLYPGETLTIRFETDEPLTTDQIASIGSGAAAIFAYGRVTYRDAFNRNRITDFCLFLHDPSIASGLPIPLNIWPEYNRAT
jgi:hypothetical protein